MNYDMVAHEKIAGVWLLRYFDREILRLSGPEETMRDIIHILNSDTKTNRLLDNPVVSEPSGITACARCERAAEIARENGKKGGRPVKQKGTRGL